MRRSLPSINEIPRVRLGVACAVVLSLVAVVVLAVANLHFGEVTYRAEFARADGARTGNEVRIAGVGVGSVTGVALDRDRIVVTFRVKKDVELGADTRAAMKMSTLLGAYYMELRPQGEGHLDDNRIPLAHTQSPYTIEDITNNSAQTLSKLDAAKLRETMAVLTKTLGRDGGRLGEALDGMSSISHIATVRQGQLTALIAAAKRATGVVMDNRKQLFSLMDGSNALLQEMLKRRDAIDDLLKHAAQLTTTLSAIIGENEKPVSKAMRDLKTVTEVLNAANASIDRALEGLAPTLRYLGYVVGSGPYGEIKIVSPLPDNYLCAVHAIGGCS